MERSATSGKISELEEAINAAHEREEDLRNHIADLEQRLAVCESDNARLRAELIEQDRVMADAIARNEELDKSKQQLELEGKKEYRDC